MARRSRERFGALAGGVLCLLGPAGCAHRAPAVIHDDTAVISGHNTTSLSRQVAMQMVLAEAAAITVDHGYRYFRLMTPVRPGADTTIHVYGKGDIDPQTPGVYDANGIAAGQMPASARPEESR